MKTDAPPPTKPLSEKEIILLQYRLSELLLTDVAIDEALQTILDMAVQSSGMECGLFYLSNASDDRLNCYVHHGLSDALVVMVAQCLQHPPNQDLAPAEASQPVMLQKLMAEEFQTLVTLPIYADEKILGWFNLASPQTKSLPLPVHQHLKTLCALLGNTLYRIEVQHALDNSQKNMDSLLQNASGYVVYLLEVDQESPYNLRQLHISPSIKPILGYDAKAWQVADYYENIHQDDKESVMEAHRVALNTGRFEATARVYNPEKDRYVWIQAISSAVLNEAGEMTHVNGLLIDVSEIQNARTELMLKEESLRIKAEKLNRLDTTLNTLLEKRNEDRLEMEQSLVFNIKEMVMPFIDKLRNAESIGHQQKLLDVVEMSLNDITSRFIHTLSIEQLGLSPTEMKVAAYVKQGKSSKEIAKLLGSSEKTVKNQRLKIRKKLGINSKKINLRAYLLSLNGA